MKLLLLTNYFSPDLSAGSFRMQSLVSALEMYKEEGLEIDVITTNPNRYKTMQVEAEALEDHGWLRIYRISIPGHSGGMIDQALAYSFYAKGLLKLTRNKQWDLVFATTSRLMTGGLGAFISWKLKVPFYLDIRDLLTDSLEDIFARSPLKFLLPVFRQIEKSSLQRAKRINLVSAGFLEHIKEIVPTKSPSLFTNGIDHIFLNYSFQKSTDHDELPLVVYAGNLGQGQALHQILPYVAKCFEGRLRFRVIGDGGQKKEFIDALRSSDVRNVEFLHPLKRTELLVHYQDADILFLHLNDFNAFKKVLPSKIFEYAATGKPLLAGVAGYAAHFLATEVPGTAIFTPCDKEAMVSQTEKLLKTLGHVNREKFICKYKRSTIMSLMAADIVDLGRLHVDKYKNQ